jgi:hypothetical protein
VKLGFSQFGGASTRHEVAEMRENGPTYLSFEYVRRLGHVVDLVAEGLTKHFMVRGGALRLSHRTVKAVDDISFTMAREETLCLVGTVDLTGHRGQSVLQLAPAAMFDACLQERTWSMDFNADLRIAQFRVYSRG